MFRSSNQSTAYHTPGTIDLVISNPVVLLNEIAKRYETCERILMEYVDNALDDAEVLFRQNNNIYPYPIEIELTIDQPTSSVIIQDNCRGMPRDVLERIVRNIGESDKRGLTWVNGRFGFGVHAFRAAAENIQIQTKHQVSSHHILGFNRDQLTGIKEAQRVDEKFPSTSGTGTIVKVSKFEREWFSSVSVDSIRQEIERHFERLLDRPNLFIRVNETDKTSQNCKPFDYRAIEGVEIQRRLDLIYQDETFPIELYLKIATDPQPGHHASFFARGRRVAAVAEIKSFRRKSKYATSLWSHPNLIGYLELGEMVQPILNRDDFVRTKRRQILYDAITGLEPDIRLALQQVNLDERQNTLEQLEEALYNVLADTENPVHSISLPARRSHKVAFVEDLPDGSGRRAGFKDGILSINMAHADFQQRLTLSRQGIPRLTDRLNAYLAGILATYSWEFYPPEALSAPSTESLLEAQLSAFIQIEENLRQQRTKGR
jgi:signal transduction histidine kinase